MMMVKWSGISVLLLLIAFAITEMAINTLSIAKSYLFSSLDSETIGVIFKSEEVMIRGSPYAGSRYDIQFEYTVDREKYIGSIVNYKGVIYQVKNTLKKYPVGESVKIHNDSLSPGYSVLEIGYLGRDVWFTLLMVVFGPPLLAYFLVMD